MWKGPVTDSPILITDWGRGEPNEDHGGNEDCLDLFGAIDEHDPRHVLYRFNDERCNSYFDFICEKSQWWGTNVVGCKFDVWWNSMHSLEAWTVNKHYYWIFMCIIITRAIITQLSVNSKWMHKICCNKCQFPFLRDMHLYTSTGTINNYITRNVKCVLIRLAKIDLVTIFDCDYRWYCTIDYVIVNYIGIHHLFHHIQWFFSH